MLIRKAFRFMFGSQTLLITNVLTSGTLMGLSDWIIQRTVVKTDVNEQKIDWARTRNYLSGLLPIVRSFVRFFCGQGSSLLCPQRWDLYIGPMQCASAGWGWRSTRHTTNSSHVTTWPFNFTQHVTSWLLVWRIDGSSLLQIKITKYWHEL